MAAAAAAAKRVRRGAVARVQMVPASRPGDAGSIRVGSEQGPPPMLYGRVSTSSSTDHLHPPKPHPLLHTLTFWWPTHQARDDHARVAGSDPLAAPCSEANQQARGTSSYFKLTNGWRVAAFIGGRLGYVGGHGALDGRRATDSRSSTGAATSYSCHAPTYSSWHGAYHQGAWRLAYLGRTGMQLQPDGPVLR